MTSFQIFASAEDRPLAERVLTEVGGDMTTVEIKAGFVNVIALADLAEVWQNRYPVNWIARSAVHQVAGGWYWTVNVPVKLLVA